MKLFGVKSGKEARSTGLALLVAATALSFTVSAHAADITDTESCNKAVQSAESQILKTDMQPDAFNEIVAAADSAKAACSSGDFAQANTLLASISKKLAAAKSN